MDGEVWWATVHGVAESWTQLSNFTFTFTYNAEDVGDAGSIPGLEDLMETGSSAHSSILAWEIP